ncbi:MAG: hypothetical protein HYR97_08700, partial [Candidatus Melainabacteria bacterium]|nr:hypothetical protein [Candidatus Melainabacteria bacterium]
NNTAFSNATWQTAYLAKELRQKKTITLSLSKQEADLLLQELRFFSNSSPIAMTKSYIGNKDQILMEITSAA